MLRNRRSTLKNWWIVLPTAIILMMALALTSTSQAAPAVEAQPLLTRLLFQEQELPCQGCHPEQYAAWQGTTHANAAMDPAFKDEFLKSHDPSACLPCHTTGFDTGTGEFHAEGVTCEACHGAYKEGHPKAETMQLPMESATCRVCHGTAFDQWETSKHAESKIDCYDCHQAHSQGLRMGNVENLCSACHSDQQTEAAHSIHGISGVDCASCHMSEQMKDISDPTGGANASMSNHTFAVASDVCTRCHTGAAHKTDGVGQTGLSQTTGATSVGTAATTTQADELKSQRVQELEQQLNEAQKRTTDLRNVAVVSMGLSLGVGGVVGLLIGIGATALLGRRKPQ